MVSLLKPDNILDEEDFDLKDEQLDVLKSYRTMRTQKLTEITNRKGKLAELQSKNKFAAKKSIYARVFVLLMLLIVGVQALIMYRQNKDLAKHQNLHGSVTDA